MIKIKQQPEIRFKISFDESPNNTDITLSCFTSLDDSKIPVIFYKAARCINNVIREYYYKFMPWHLQPINIYACINDGVFSYVIHDINDIYSFGFITRVREQLEKLRNDDLDITSFLHLLTYYDKSVLPQKDGFDNIPFDISWFNTATDSFKKEVINDAI